MYFKNNECSLYYEKYGNEDKYILILPGWGDTRGTFNYMIEHLKDKYTIYIIDWFGFGNSEFPDYDLTIYDYANVIRDFIEKENIDNPILIAHSFGGRIATLISGYYKDEINKLILIDIAGIKPKKNIFKLIKTYTYKLLKKLSVLIPKRKRNLYLKRLFRHFASTDYKELDNSMYQTFKNVVNEDLKFTYKAIKQEALLIWGENDKSTPLKDGIYMRKNISNSSLIIYPNSGHFSYLDYPILTNKIIDEFLTE